MTIFNQIRFVFTALLLCVVCNVWADENPIISVVWTPSELFSGEEMFMSKNHSERKYSVGDDAIVEIIFTKAVDAGSVQSKYYGTSAKQYSILKDGHYMTFKAKEGYVLTKIQYNKTDDSSLGCTVSMVDNWGSDNKIINGQLITSSNKKIGWQYSVGSYYKALNHITFKTGDIYNGTFFKSITIEYTKVEETGETIKISEAQHCTFYNDLGYFMPTNCSGYIVSLKTNPAEGEGNLITTLAYGPGDYVPSNTPMLIIGAQGTYKLGRYKDSVGNGDKRQGNCLRGDIKETKHPTADETTAGTYYQFSYGNEKTAYENVLGFYWQEGSDRGQSIVNGANKCYLFIPSTSPSTVKGYTIDGLPIEEANAISAIMQNNGGHNGKLYNMQGQQVDESYRGIVIRDGKKFQNK